MAWVNVSDECKDLIERMIVVDPLKRISIEGVLGHPWITKNSHNEEPLSPVVNAQLEKVHNKYRRKMAGAGKAALAAMMMAAAAAKRRSDADIEEMQTISDREVDIGVVKA
jgi:serine/threonine protein kinase